ncbi:MAG TPA: hypothetical protein VFM18_11720 [Methanosarcina sp.]|nr:hypothetical protein [Methanosarcina sp.]
MATNFALSTTTSDQQIIQSLNYALANLGSTTVNYNGNVVVANVTTGALSTAFANGTINTQNISYLYGYVDIMYANSSTGSSGFTSNSFHANYYGVYNTSSSVQSNNPVDYQWTQVSGGFGTKALWYTTAGGGKINFLISNTSPGLNYYPVIDNTPILLASLANSIVTTNSILPGAVTNVSIAANTIQANNISASAITTDKIAGNTIQANNLAAAVITTDKIAANTIQANNLAAAAITTDKIAANTIQANNISASAITTDKIAANTIQANNIFAGAITTDKIAANTIQANNISASAITTDKIAANTIQTNNLAAGVITADKIQANILLTGNIAANNATFGSTSSAGYWMRNTDGAAYFKGTTTIGDSLSVGNNASVGNFLTVGANASVGANLSVGTGLSVGASAIIGNNLTVGNNAVIGNNLYVTGLITSGALNANTVVTNTITPGSITSTLYLDATSLTNGSYTGATLQSASQKLLLTSGNLSYNVTDAPTTIYGILDIGAYYHVVANTFSNPSAPVTALMSIERYNTVSNTVASTFSSVTHYYGTQNFLTAGATQITDLYYGDTMGIVFADTISANGLYTYSPSITYAQGAGAPLNTFYFNVTPVQLLIMELRR